MRYVHRLSLGTKMDINWYVACLQACYFMEATKMIASMPPGHCLGALKNAPVEIYNFFIHVGCPFLKEKMPLSLVWIYDNCSPKFPYVCFFPLIKLRFTEPHILIVSEFINRKIPLKNIFFFLTKLFSETFWKCYLITIFKLHGPLIWDGLTTQRAWPFLCNR